MACRKCKNKDIIHPINTMKWVCAFDLFVSSNNFNVESLKHVKRNKKIFQLDGGYIEPLIVDEYGLVLENVWIFYLQTDESFRKTYGTYVPVVFVDSEVELIDEQKMHIEDCQEYYEYNKRKKH